MSLIALGVTPYITASIMIQLSTSVVPSLMSLKKEGESGQYEILVPMFLTLRPAQSA